MWYKIYIPLDNGFFTPSRGFVLILTRDPSETISFTVPLYIQIAEGLISQIESGELMPGAQLAPERELSLELNVTRMTLRRALHVLESQGLIVRKHGVGNFIAEAKIDRQMETIYRFNLGMQNRGFTPGSKLILIKIIQAEHKLAKDLGLPPSSKVYDILRLRSVNQEPVMLESYKIPIHRFPGLDQFDLENRSIYEIIEIEYGVKIARNRQSLEPIIATEFEAELLNINPGEALMLEKRISYDAEDQPIEFGKDRYRGDRFRFITDSSPKDN